MPIFPKPIDLAADYVWTGDHTFDGVVTCNGDFNAVDGSFTGNLTSEVGGSYKLYNLGDESATDSEFVSMAWDASKLKILTDKTGSGAVRDIELSANQVALKYNSGTSVSTRVSCDSNSIKVWRNLYNGVNGLYACGLSTNRWSTVFSINGNFSGNITAENLPTSDPGVPGQFYVTTGGALKVSQ